MRKNVLLVGCKYTGEEIADVRIDVLGLCRPGVDRKRAAYALYEYDVVIINPESYSHFMFGEPTSYSNSAEELWDLKRENNSFDLDTAFDHFDRSAELTTAIDQGARVIWLLAKEKVIKFFGTRRLTDGYANLLVEKLVTDAQIHEKKSRKLETMPSVGEFQPYFEQLRLDGWSISISDHGNDIKAFAKSPEGHTLGGKIKIGSSHGWLMTPPTSQAATNALVRCAAGTESIAVAGRKYHGLFLSHTSADKPFVRLLKSRLNARGAKNIWLDEAEILVGDSLIRKIEDGLRKTKYIGVVLSQKSIRSRWVERELEIAINREIATGEVVVLPLLYEACELPAFLAGKMYADFTSESEFEAGVLKILRRLKKT